MDPRPSARRLLALSAVAQRSRAPFPAFTTLLTRQRFDRDAVTGTAKRDRSTGYVVIIRGPLGVGKTTVSQRLATELGAEYISIDRILDDEEIWDEGALSEFLRANDFAAPRAELALPQGTPVIFDGNFYWEAQIADLVGRLPYPHFAFTLEAPLAVCIERDARRNPPHGNEAARQVFENTTRFDYGIKVDASRPVEWVVHEIELRISTSRAGSPS